MSCVQLEYFNKERKGTYKSKWKTFKSKKELSEMVNPFCTDYAQAGAPHWARELKKIKSC